jgi:hypothetical protein
MHPRERALTGRSRSGVTTTTHARSSPWRRSRASGRVISSQPSSPSSSTTCWASNIWARGFVHT